MKVTCRLAACALLAFTVGCADHDPPAPIGAGESIAGPAAAAPGATGSPEAQRLERQARRLARALGDPAFREYLLAQLRASPVVEHKLQFQRWLSRDGRRALEAMSGAEGEDASAVLADATAGLAAELYFPVPGHLERWDGGPDLLVATAIQDRDAPVAYDTHGRRVVLDPGTPPPTPVLALVPQETNFDRLPDPRGAVCGFEECGSGGGGTGGGSGGSGGSGASPPVQNLYLTRAQFVDTFEGWLKGNPEFELHVLGPASAGDSSMMTSYQCVGEHAPSGYSWDMNSKSWSGAAKVFTQAQMDAFEQAYAGRSYLLMALEDDDTACEIKMGQDRVGDLLSSLKSTYQSYIGLKDIKVVTINGVTRIITAARSGAGLISALANAIRTNDDLIGIAMADSVVGRASSVGHWAVMDGSTKVNGWLNLEMR